MEWYLIGQMVYDQIFKSMFDELKELKYFKEITDFKSLVM